MPIRLYAYNPADWSLIGEKQGYAFSNVASDLAFDPETQALYGIASDEDYSGTYKTLGRVTYEDKEQDGHTFNLYHFDPIGELPENMVALTFNRDGKLYTISATGKLYTVDKFSGKATLVGSTGKDIVPFKQSATCDYTTGKIYWAALDADYWATQIMEVDPATASSTMLTDFVDDGYGSLDQFTGIYIKQDLNLATLPNKVDNLTVSASSLTEASVKFTMPTKDIAGNALSGNLNYTIRVNGESVATGSAAPGDAVAKTVAAAQSGESTFGVTAEIPATADTPAAISETAKAKAQSGNDAPKDPTDVKATANGQDITVTWTPSTESAHGGNFDKENVTYNVARFEKDNQKDSVIVATGIKETTVADHIDSREIKIYFYRVTAVNGDAKSNSVESNWVKVGDSAPLPYSNGLDTQDKFDEMTVVDANNDGSTWTFDTNYTMAQYAANSTNDADDWLISPAIDTKKGAAYKFSFDAVNSYPDEIVAASVGTEPTAEAMQTEIIAPTTVTYQPRRRTLTGTFRATEDGLRYFGIHALSEKDHSTLYVDNLNISEIPATAPNNVTDLTVVPGEKGATTAKLTYKAPTTTMGGEPLEGNLYIKIYRNGEQIISFANVAPGAEGSYDDLSVPQGETKYAVTAVNADGLEGIDATAKVFVGNDVPGSVRNLRAYEDSEKEGLIHVTWDAPEGIHGGYINPADLTYYVSAGMSSEEQTTTDNHYEDQLDMSSGKQKFNAYSVYAVSSTGGGREYWKTVSAIGGPSLKAPMIESFKNTTMTSGPWITTVTKGEVGEAYCYAMTNSLVTNAEDQDNGMQSFSAEQNGKAVRSESPKVDISALDKPVLNFWAYMNGKGEKMRISVQKDYKEFENVFETSSDKYEKGWTRFHIDLTPYKNSKFIRVGFEAESVKDIYDFMAYDNVAIVEDATNDLMAMELTADKNEVKVGNELNLNFSLRNNANTFVNGGDYDVVLMKNGVEASRIKGEDVEQDMVKTITLSDKPTVFDPTTTKYTAKIEYAADKITGNNSAESEKFKFIMPEYPVPTSLTAVSGNGQAELSWTAPDLINRKPAVTTDDFDSYKAFIIDNVGGWTMYDGDKQNTIQITLNESFGPLQYDNAGKPMAFQVFNVEDAGIPFKSWDPHSGNQMLVSFSCASTDGGFTKKQNDDWLISPELNGEAQQIKLYAKAGLASAVPEQMEILYSTTDKAVGSFTKIGDTVDVDNVSDWNEYSFDLPEGAKYFAVRCVSNDKFALLIDDISYTAAGSEPEEITLQGYNVYRDKKKLNEEPVTEAAYNDMTAVMNEKYGYQVTAVYDKGESMPSNLAELTYVSGISDVNATGVSVIGEEGAILVAGANGKSVRVYAAGGNLESQFVAGETVRINAAAGLHIVNVAGKTYKVLVK